MGSLQVDDFFTIGSCNSSKIIVHYLLIRGMTYLDDWDEFSMIRALICMVTY